MREALGLPDAYASAGVDDALSLFERASRLRRFGIPPTTVRLPDRQLILGPVDGEGGDRPSHNVTLMTDIATLVRMLTGRSRASDRQFLYGATPAQYVMFH